jgi:hypothetical protein
MRAGSVLASIAFLSAFFIGPVGARPMFTLGVRPQLRAIVVTPSSHSWSGHWRNRPGFRRPWDNAGAWNHRAWDHGTWDHGTWDHAGAWENARSWRNDGFGENTGGNWTPVSAGFSGFVTGVGPDAPYTGSAIYYPPGAKKKERSELRNQDDKTRLSGRTRLPDIVYGIAPERSGGSVAPLIFGGQR